MLTLLFHGNILLGDLLSCSAIHSILGHTSLELLELRLDLTAFCLLLIKFCLELRSHLVVAILGLLKVEADLMHVGKSVEILVLVHLLSVGLSSMGSVVIVRSMHLLLKGSWLHEHDLPLKFFIVTL
jgi:hypothetical protein